MELKLFAVDFAKDTISFKVPHETMENTMWTGGYAHIDLSRISHTENESGVETDAESRCNCNSRGFSQSTGGCPIHGVKY